MRKRVIAIQPHILKNWLGNKRFELLTGSDIHASLGDPAALESTREANIKVGVKLMSVRVEIMPAGLRRVESREEEITRATEVIGLNKMEGVADVLAVGSGITR